MHGHVWPQILKVPILCCTKQTNLAHKGPTSQEIFLGKNPLNFKGPYWRNQGPRLPTPEFSTALSVQGVRFSTASCYCQLAIRKGSSAPRRFHAFWHTLAVQILCGHRFLSNDGVCAEHDGVRPEEVAACWVGSAGWLLNLFSN